VNIAEKEVKQENKKQKDKKKQSFSDLPVHVQRCESPTSYIG
jgi:hypothetical protein